MLARLANPAHASWVVLLLVASTVAETIPRHGPAVRPGVTMLGLFDCLVLALPGLTMALGVGVGVGVGVGALVSLLIGASQGSSGVGSAWLVVTVEGSLVV